MEAPYLGRQDLVCKTNEWFVQPGKLAREENSSCSYTCSFMFSLIHLFSYLFIWQEFIEDILCAGNVSGALRGRSYFGKQGFFGVPTVSLG